MAAYNPVTHTWQLPTLCHINGRKGQSIPPATSLHHWRKGIASHQPHHYITGGKTMHPTTTSQHHWWKGIASHLPHHYFVSHCHIITSLGEDNASHLPHHSGKVTCPTCHSITSLGKGNVSHLWHHYIMGGKGMHPTSLDHYHCPITIAITTSLSVSAPNSALYPGRLVSPGKCITISQWPWGVPYTDLEITAYYDNTGSIPWYHNIKTKDSSLSRQQVQGPV